ncbi:hypothetical protein [Paenibacillus sp. USDA918EY]|uniref:hypothetical protein n=1 Tax=Paenibacillus sp. USDA918EY TaxID=2689575 RepID=UPI001359D09F|nr:hypothetical protein [Paenibacillus sp. USDA918EY]
MKKEWVTVKEHRGHKIQILNGAGAGECMDYKIVPDIRSSPECTYPTIRAAIEAIDEDEYAGYRNAKRAVIDKHCSFIEEMLGFYKVDEAILIDTIKRCMNWTYEDAYRDGVNFVLNFRERKEREELI